MNPCGYCGKYGHIIQQCHKRKFEQPSSQLLNKKFKQEVSNVGEEDAIEIVSTARDDMDMDQLINQKTFDTSDQDKYCSISFNLDRGVICDRCVQIFDFRHLLN